MPSINGIRILNNIETGTTDSTALQTLLGTTANYGAWQSLLSSEPHVERILESDSAWTATLNSNLALQTLANSKDGFTTLFNNKTRLNALVANRTRMQHAMSNAPFMNQNYTTNASWISRDIGFGFASATRDAVAVTVPGSTTVYTVVGDHGRIAVSTDNLVTWNSRTSNFGQSNITGIAYGNSLYVIVGDDGKISTSSDGITWTARTSQFGTTLIRAVAFANGLFVAVGNQGKVSTSSDGITWTARTSQFGTTNISGIAYGNSTWVVIGDQGKISSSTDGTTWTTRTSGVSISFTGITYGQRFVVVGDDGNARVSLNGTTWTSGGTVRSGVTRIVGVTEQLGRYFAVYHTGSAIYMSWGTDYAVGSGSWPATDEVVVSTTSQLPINIKTVGGVVFVFANNSGLYTSTGIASTASTVGYVYSGSGDAREIAFGNGAWVVAGSNGVRYQTPGLLGLPPSSTWMNPGNPGGNEDVRSVRYLNNLFVLGAANGILYTSSTGISWTTAASQASGTIVASAYGNSTYVLVASNGNISTSPNGTTWTARSAPLTDRGWTGLAFGNGLFVAVASNSTNNTQHIYTSPDGITWTARTSAFTSGSNGCGTIFFGGGLFVVGGNVSVGQLNISSDGINWTLVQLGGAIASANFAYPGVYANGLYTIAANNTMGGNRYVLSSADGINWSGVITNNSNYAFTGFAYGQGYVVGVTYYNSSTSYAESWVMLGGLGYSTRNIGFGTTTIAHLAFDNNLYVAVGGVGKISTSTDGITWTARTSNAGTSTLTQSAYGNGLWVVVGSAGRISTSSDGITWTTRSSGTNQALRSVAYGNGVWVAAGDGDVIVTSTDGITWTLRLSYTGVNTAIYKVIFANDLFIVIADNGKISSSPDGMTWTMQIVGALSSGNIRSIAYGNGLFVVGTSSGYIATSPDGVDWNPQNLPQLSSGINDIAYGNGLWIMVGSSPGGNRVVTSTNGIDWKTASISSSNPITGINAVTYANGIFMISGDALYATF